VSIDSLIITIFGILFLANLSIEQLIKLAKRLRELQSAVKGVEPAPPPRFLDQNDSKHELNSNGP